ERTMFKDVAGAKEAKEELQEIVEFLKNPKKFLDIGAKIPKGVLLMGPPGSGKTLLAKAVSGEAGVPFFHMSASEFIEMFVGVGASRVRDLFKQAKKVAPAIIFVDELDAIGRMRGAGVGGGHDEREQTLNQILVEMDGMETDDRVIVMAATNRPDVLDTALLRPGRFDRRVILDVPGLNDRIEILAIHTKNKPLEEDVQLRVIAERTPGFSGADLANLVNEAAILAARFDKKLVGQMDLINSIEKVMLGPARKSNLLTPKEKNITAYHEAGHALVAASLPNADPVHKISIVSRGRAGGYTLKLPSEDRHLYSRAHLLDEMAVSLGGYVAEQIIFGDLTTGASDDLRKVTDVARSLVTRFGMSEKIGPMVLGEKEEMIFLGKEIGTERNYSEDTARLIDQEMKHLITEAFTRTKEILTKRHNKLEEIAKVLMEKETIEREEF
ncbi:MAG: ATP-dependent zinc metalloprotease FtsH, partial [Patescibacteria group bacterium]